GQVHSLFTPETEWLQLNTHIPPFSDVRVREALNFAVDRAAIARMYGGRPGAIPTCQLLPPDLPGYRPYCPYTQPPAADGRWHAADLARARALVAASHTRGDQISVYGKIGGGVLCTTVVHYTARVLRGLGYRVQTYIVKDDSKTDWSVVNVACRGDQDTEPADFFGNLGCTSLADHGWFCGRRF